MYFTTNWVSPTTFPTTVSCVISTSLLLSSLFQPIIFVSDRANSNKELTTDEDAGKDGDKTHRDEKKVSAVTGKAGELGLANMKEWLWKAQELSKEVSLDTQQHFLKSQHNLHLFQVDLMSMSRDYPFNYLVPTLTLY